MAQTPHVMEREITKSVKLDYFLHLPDGYEGSDQKWPLILFLHGAGERGNDIEQVKIHGIPKIVQMKTDFPFIAISPQCPEDLNWNMEQDALHILLDEVIANYEVDTDRVYLTGLSMGGYGTWALAASRPERFAAIAPICGGGNPNKVEALKHMPVWVFHGAKDTAVTLDQSERMVEALNAIGGNVKFTVYPEAGHDSWTETYDNPELYDWFLSHKRS